jgi:phage tail protein X
MSSPCTYRTVHGDMVDAIAWKHYGHETALVDILAANPHLADQGPILPGGILITLPQITRPQAAANRPPLKLWD